MPNVLSRGLFNLFFGARRKALEGLPGPQPGLLGNVGDFLGTPPWDVCARYGREYGGITLVWMGPSPAIVLNDPALIEEVMETRRLEFEKGNVSDQVRPTVTDDTAFIATQREWAAKRQVDPLAQPWSSEWLAAQVGPWQASVGASLEALMAQGTLDITPAIRRMTFDAFCVSTVGEKLPDQAYDDFMLLARGADARIQAKLPLRFVSLPKGFEAARARFYGQFTDRVRAARRSPGSGGGGHDLLSWTVRGLPDMSDQEMGNLLGSVFYGGVFSSSTTLVGAFHQLQKYPDVEARLAAEAATLAEGPLTFKALSRAHWTEAVAYEALRILPAVRVFTRMPSADAKLAGVTLPAGTTILISNQHLHRDPAHWTAPDTFDPSRWLDGGAERDPLGSGHFFPFGRGPRACVGAPFAMVYLETALATLTARARVHVDSTEPFQEDFFFGVVLPKGVMGRFVARPRSAGHHPVGDGAPLAAKAS